MDTEFPKDGDQALRWLLEGNERFLAGKSQHERKSHEWRSRLTRQQRPFATVLGCSDSRVPVELVFDQGFGDLFIVRVAGNVVGTSEKGSIAFAVDYLKTPLVLVLGHGGCGAVTAALMPESERQKETAFLQDLLKRIDPALKNIDRSLPEAERVGQGVEANVRWSVKELREWLGNDPILDTTLVAGAVYELDSGKVRVIE